MILPKKVVNEIESICRSFLWNGSHALSSSEAVAWSSVCLPKSAGGLSFRSISDWNLAAMFKYVWAIAKKRRQLIGEMGALCTSRRKIGGRIGPLQQPADIGASS
uniref:Uncharacterized protein n=1 Tax=Cannabis sativa TaxID=3483 RepID=A0A803PBV5_CANSA